MTFVQRMIAASAAATHRQSFVQIVFRGGRDLRLLGQEEGSFIWRCLGKFPFVSDRLKRIIRMSFERRNLLNFWLFYPAFFISSYPPFFFQFFLAPFFCLEETSFYFLAHAFFQRNCRMRFMLL